MLQFIICTHGIAPDQRLLDAFFYQEARHWGNLRPGFSFLPPDRQRQLPYPVVAGTGAATCLCCTRLFLRRRGRAVAIGATVSRFPAGNSSCCVSPAGGRQHGAGGPCCFTGPANLVGSPGAAGQTSPVFQCCGPLPSGRRFIPSSFPRTTAANARWPTFPPGVIFSRSIPMRQDDRPFWQEVREELDPRKNVVGWAAAIIMLVVVCVFGGINDHPAEPAMRPATIVSK